MAHRDAIQVITKLGDTVVEHAIVHEALQVGDVLLEPTPAGYAARHPGRDPVTLARGDALRIPCGLGWTTATIVASPRGALPRPPADRRAATFLVVSLAAHLAILAIAWPAHPEQPRGQPRRGVVANHFSAPSATPAPRESPSIDQADASTLAPSLAPTPVDVPPPGERGAVKLPAQANAANEERTHDTTEARHFDPCADGDCGLIATGNYDTRPAGHHAGDDYALHAREPRALETSVVTCSSDGCNTVSGTDQGDLRGELARHVTDLDACFERGHADGPIAVDLQIDDNGDAHVVPRERNDVERCVVDVIAKLSFPRGERAVTLAFARS